MYCILDGKFGEISYFKSRKSYQCYNTLVVVIVKSLVKVVGFFVEVLRIKGGKGVENRWYLDLKVYLPQDIKRQKTLTEESKP